MRVDNHRAYVIECDTPLFLAVEPDDQEAAISGQVQAIVAIGPNFEPLDAYRNF